MMKTKYLISIDQSTQGTKALLFDPYGNLIKRTDKAHRQIINEKGWVSHDPLEIYASQYGVLIEVLARSGLDAGEIAGIGITNQRETTIVWDKATGRPV